MFGSEVADIVGTYNEFDVEEYRQEWISIR